MKGGALRGVLTALTVLSSWRPVVEANGAAQNQDEFLRANPELVEFFHLIQQLPQVTSILGWTHGTFFAPTNASISDFRRRNPGKFNNDTLHYHFANSAYPASDIEGTVNTELSGNPPLWVTRVESFIYLNEAKVLRSDKRVRMGPSQNEQIVHVIDKVLEPTVPRTQGGRKNPDAAKYMESSHEYPITGDYKTSMFFEQVKAKGQLKSFQNPGRNTFFIPVDAGFGNTRPGMVDEKVIDGHMIFGNAIFLGIPQNGNKDLKFETSAGANNFPVEVTLKKQGGSDNWQVMSENLVPDAAGSGHQAGRVQAQILKANIPVNNGVVHLISRPLVIIDSDVLKTMQRDTGPLKYFYELIQNATDTPATNNQFEEIRGILQDKENRITLFAPTTRVLETSGNFQDLLNHTKASNGKEKDEALLQLARIIKLHIVKKDLTAEDITNSSKDKLQPFHVTPVAANRTLYFNVIKSSTGGRDKIAVVDSGGTSAIISQADIGATNGVIHQIDRVLGIGDNTIFDKLKTDPFIKKTYNISTQDHFNQIFRNKDQEFTFFAPWNGAWDGIKYESPSAYQTLSAGRHGRHSAKIMQRHLIPGKLLSLEDLWKISTNGGHNKTVGLTPIRTLGGEIRVTRYNGGDDEYKKHVRQYGYKDPRVDISRNLDPKNIDYIIFWESREIRVMKGDVKCSNGYVHVIDTVMMTSNDVVVNSVPSAPASSSLLLMILMAWLLVSY